MNSKIGITFVCTSGDDRPVALHRNPIRQLSGFCQPVATRLAALIRCSAYGRALSNREAHMSSSRATVLLLFFDKKLVL